MPRGFRNPMYEDIDNDADTTPDALDVDRTSDPALDGVMKGGQSLPEPTFDLIRQAYPNTRRPQCGPYDCFDGPTNG